MAASPAPWVSYTRDGCDVGNVSVANTVLENNTLYWRVRPVDVSGAVGQWTEGSQFTQDGAVTPDQYPIA